MVGLRTKLDKPLRVPFFSITLVFRIFSLIISFCRLRSSVLFHHIGRAYSHSTQRLMQALQAGRPSSHFFLRSRQVKQPDILVQRVSDFQYRCNISTRNNWLTRSRSPMSFRLFHILALWNINFHTLGGSRHLLSNIFLGFHPDFSKNILRYDDIGLCY